MNDFNRTIVSFLVFAVCLHAITAFRFPGFQSSGGDGGRRPPVNAKRLGVKVSPTRDNVLMGEVFIIRELQNKDENGRKFDAFITNGIIQEVKPQDSPSRTAGEQDEDTDYFGVLISSKTVKMLQLDQSIMINVPLSVLVNAKINEMEWLMVLRRDNYKDVLEKLENPTAAATAAATATPQMDGIPNMQIPQRRGYYSADRHRRDIRQSYPGADERSFSSPPGPQYDDAEPAAALERKLLSTMCYNFVRQNADSESRLQVELTRSDGVKCGDGDLQLVQYDSPVTFDLKPYIRAAVNRAQPMPQQPTAAEEFVA